MEKNVYDFSDEEDNVKPPLQSNTKRKQLGRIKRNPTNKKDSDKENKLVSSPLRESGSKSVIGNAICLICRQQFPDDESRTIHMPHCPGLSRKEENKMVAGVVVQSCSSLKNEEISTCPVCSKQFDAGESDSAKEIHTNKCLDNSTMEILEQEKTDEILARTLQYSDEGALPEDQYCMMCHKDIGKYTFAQRSKHYNDCMDKTEKSKRINPSRKAKVPTNTNKRPSKVPKKMCPVCKLDQPENVSSCNENSKRMVYFQKLLCFVDMNPVVKFDWKPRVLSRI